MQADTDGRIGFAFQEILHEPGSKTVLGARYAEAGVEEGERVIRALVRHPSTARFLATKLVAHFVSDEPPASAVDRIARVFRDTEGDLRAVSAALVDLPEAWSEGARKFRTPQDWLVAVLRAFDAGEVSETTMPVLRQLRHPLWSPQAPKGFGDKTQEWADPDSLLNRAELARTIARRLRAATQRIDPRILLDVVDVPAGDPLHTLLADNSIARRRADRARAGRPRISMEMTMNRRTFVRNMCLGGIATFGFPVVNFAQAKHGGRFVFVLLRGGFDGLAAVVPYGDPSYRSLRGAFAFEESELVELTETFGLAPGLAPLRELWQKNELVALHAMAIPYRTRSHFDGQAILETGIDKPVGIVRRLAESPAAGDARPAIRHRDRVGHAALADRARTTCRRGRPHSSAPSTTRIWIGCRRCIAPTKCCTAASKRRCSSRISSARSRWPAAARGAAASRR